MTMTMTIIALVLYVIPVVYGYIAEVADPENDVSAHDVAELFVWPVFMATSLIEYALSRRKSTEDDQ